MSSQRSFVGDGAIRANLAPSVLARSFDGEMILLHTHTGDYFALNHVGQEVVRDLCDGHSLEECAGRLYSAYEVEWAILCSDVVALCRELLARGLIVLRANGP